MFNGHKLELNELRLLCFRSKKFLSLLLLFWPVWTFIFVFFNCLYLFLTVFYNSALIYNSNDFITWSANVDLHPNWLEEYLGHFLKWHCKQKRCHQPMKTMKIWKNLIRNQNPPNCFILILEVHGHLKRDGDLPMIVD